MSARLAALLSGALLAITLAFSTIASTAVHSAQDSEDGIVRVRSAYPMRETIARLKEEIAAKGITFFLEVDQSKLASDAGIALRPSTLLVFGNPALGSQFITSKAEAGIDWPVRLLVIENERGQVWAVYTDFGWIARRHRIADRKEAFTTASNVIASITSSVAAK